MHKAKDRGHRAHGQKEIMHVCGPKSTPIAQGLVKDINAMHAYGRSSAPIAQGLLYDINAPHAFGLRESKPNAMHAYGRSCIRRTERILSGIQFTTHFIEFFVVETKPRKKDPSVVLQRCAFP